MTAHVRSIFGVKIFKRKHKTLRFLNKNRTEPSLYGDQLWQSSFLIMDYLQKNPIPPKQNIFDIGCGWGILGIFCAKSFNSNVTLIDADQHVFPFADSHGSLNEVALKTRHAQFVELSQKDFSDQYMIIGSDICFWPELVSQLKSLIGKALDAGVEKIIIADPGRSTFLGLAKFCEKHYNSKLIPSELSGESRAKGFLLVIDNPYFVERAC